MFHHLGSSDRSKKVIYNNIVNNIIITLINNITLIITKNIIDNYKSARWFIRNVNMKLSEWGVYLLYYYSINIVLSYF